MDKNEIINLLESAKKDYQSFLNNKNPLQDFKPCEFGFCWYFKRKGFRYDYENFNAIISELEKDKIGENHDDDHWYPTIFYNGNSINKLKDVSTNIIRFFGLFPYQIKRNNEILQKKIDHLERTISRLKNQT